MTLLNEKLALVNSLSSLIKRKNTKNISHCNSAECAVSEIWGEEIGLK